MPSNRDDGRTDGGDEEDDHEEEAEVAEESHDSGPGEPSAPEPAALSGYVTPPAKPAPDTPSPGGDPSSRSSNNTLRALGTALAAQGIVDHLAASIQSIKKEREQAMEEQRARDAALRNEQRKKQRLLRKVERVSTDELMYVLNTCCVRQAARDAASPAPASTTPGSSGSPTGTPSPKAKAKASAGVAASALNAAEVSAETTWVTPETPPT